VNESEINPFERGEKLVGKLPVYRRIAAGSLLERTVRHTKDCPKMRAWRRHRVFVLTVTMLVTQRQLSVRRERVAEVRRWLDTIRS